MKMYVAMGVYVVRLRPLELRLLVGIKKWMCVVLFEVIKLTLPGGGVEWNTKSTKASSVKELRCYKPCFV